MCTREETRAMVTVLLRRRAARSRSSVGGRPPLWELHAIVAVVLCFRAVTSRAIVRAHPRVSAIGVTRHVTDSDTDGGGDSGGVYVIDTIPDVSIAVADRDAVTREPSLTPSPKSPSPSTTVIETFAFGISCDGT